MVLFARHPTACGAGQTQMGPFYCPLDQKIYIDLAFYDELKRRFKLRATSPRPTSSRTRSGTTSRRCSASRTRCTA